MKGRGVHLGNGSCSATDVLSAVAEFFAGRAARVGNRQSRVLGAPLRLKLTAAAVLSVLACAAVTTLESVAHAQAPAVAASAAPVPPLPLASPARVRRQRLAAVTSWRYQLRRIDIAEVAASAADLVVIDYAPDRVYGVELPFTREDVARMQRKPDGRARILLAYLSIGEAERYRTYWNNAWYDAPTRPEWLLAPNPQWDGNFPVRFWHPNWQAIVFGTAEAYLDRILAAGFDGVYLDRADVYQELVAERPGAEDDMAHFIVSLARHARTQKRDALFVMQNAEELVRRRAVRHAIDAVAKEDLLNGVNHDEKPNPQEMVRDTLADLTLARNAGRAILVVEYLSNASAAQHAVSRIKSYGYLPLIAERSLGTLEFKPARSSTAGTDGKPLARRGNARRGSAAR